MKTPSGHGLGLKRQLADHRDFRYTPPTGITLPAHVDLRTNPHRPPIWQQGGLGSCTSFASARIAEQTYGTDGFHNQFEPSHLYIYWNTRNLEGTTAQDAGASMRDTMIAIAKQGVCAEHFWPYSDADPGPFSQQPPPEAYANAAKHLATSYHAVSLDLVSMKSCLAEGYPFMVGIDVFASFESPHANATGIIPMPDRLNEQLLGGHACTVQGFDDAQQWFICDNSWGQWGDKGSYYLPYAFLTDPNLAYDAWTIRTQR